MLALVASQFPGGTSPALAAASPLKLLAPAGYLPQVPVLVRVEVQNPDGGRDRNVWDAEAILSASDPGVTLSTNRVWLRNGLGSALVSISGGGDFVLTATWDGEQASRELRSLTNLPVTTVGGLLAGSATVWSGVVRITNDVTVPAGHTLTIESNTLVMLDGVASGSTAPDILVNGRIQSLGSEDHPVTITCVDPALRWGQIRHSAAQPSLYRWTHITRAGRGTGEGHTGTTPVIRPSGSTITFEHCSLTDFATAAGTPGKVMFAVNSDLVFDDCLLARARMGPEIQGTGLLCTNTWILDMYGPDDADGIYPHDSSGKPVRFADCVIAGGNDDGIDTLNASVEVERTIIRDWPSSSEDAKGISAFGGTTVLRRCLFANCYVGIAAKSGGSPARVFIEHCTITGITRGVSAAYKDNAQAGNIDFRITNSIVQSPDAVHTDFGPTNFTIGFCLLAEDWPGVGNFSGDPRFVDAAGFDFRLQADSPCIDAGDPASAWDPDGTPADVGRFSFNQPPARLLGLRMREDGRFEFRLSGMAGRAYRIEATADFGAWTALGTITNLTGETLWADPFPGTNQPGWFYRAGPVPSGARR